MYTRLSRKRVASALTEAPVTSERAQRDIAWCAGTEQFQRRDPLYHITESFCTTFNRIGQQHAARMAVEFGAGFSQEELQETDERRVATAEREERGERKGSGERRTDSPKPKRNTQIQQFSEMAFQRGSLAASVLAGTGKMMLVSCIKRAVAQGGPKHLQQKRVLGIGSQTRNVPGHDPDRMLFNRGFTNSAVGLVVDTLRDARRTVDSMAEMAEGIGELGQKESGTLRTMYPFLDSSREALVLEQYRDRLRMSEDPRERAVLQGAIVKAEALRTKKAQMKNEFINKLRSVSDRATATLEELERPGAGDEIMAALFDTTSQAEDDGDTDNGQEGADAPDEAEDRFDPADWAGTGQDPGPAGAFEI